MSDSRPYCECHKLFYENCPTFKMGLCITIGGLSNNVDLSEGVAAPLEPLAINFANQLMGVLNDLYGHTFDILGEQAIVHALDSFAAAVSKNLQEELANAKRMLYELTPEDIRGMAYDANALLQAKVAELESEITALRETRK